MRRLGVLGFIWVVVFMSALVITDTNVIAAATIYCRDVPDVAMQPLDHSVRMSLFAQDGYVTAPGPFDPTKEYPDAVTWRDVCKQNEGRASLILFLLFHGDSYAEHSVQRIVCVPAPRHHACTRCLTGILAGR